MTDDDRPGVTAEALRGVFYGMAFSAVIVVAVLAILWIATL